MSRARPDPSSKPAGPTPLDGASGRNGGARSHRRRGPGAEVLRFDIPSDLDEGRTVQDAILKACREMNFDEDAYFAVKLALDEAVTNAIKHGNRLDPGKRVEVVAKINARRAEIQIRDEGPGFDRTKVPDPTIDENIGKCSGRGLLLIEAYMSSVSWSEDGRTICMIRDNVPDPQQASGPAA